MICTEKLNESATEICRTLRGNGHQAYLVGGVCRDLVIGRSPKDWDIVTDASPDAIKSMFSRSLGIGESYGVVSVMLNGEAFDVATFRQDVGYSDGRRPDEVRFVQSLDEDASRRDFTMNAIYVDPIEGIIHDPMNGHQDIENRVIRFIGNPMDRLNEDRLRALRAVRFSAQLGFDIEDSALVALKTLADGGDPFLSKDAARAVSMERIREELSKILVSKRPVRGIMLLKDTGLLDYIVPEYKDMWACHQSKRWHQEGSAAIHSMCVLGKCESPRLEDRLACFLHDIAKPQTLTIKDVKEFNEDGSKNRDYGPWKYANPKHDVLGAEIAKDILVRLKFTNVTIDEVTTVIRHHMDAHNLVEWKKTWKIRRFIGSKYFDKVVQLALTDEAGSMSNEPYDSLVEFVAKYREKYPVMLPAPFVTGETLIARGYKPGPAFKAMLDETYNHQLDGWDEAWVLSLFKGPKA